ncbi:hypothetical protein [Robiginitalea sp. IMCC43444]|uniref:hypothetical protein n=1 Tax=Robiginitalea sp. IMCC43444 TaxID=3459121 RepID=UPI004042B501
MITCEKAANICNKSQYREAGFLERIQLGLHLLICKTCAGFSSKNKQLTNLCKQAHLRALPEREKAEMKRRLLRDLKG